MGLQANDEMIKACPPPLNAHAIMSTWELPVDILSFLFYRTLGLRL